LLRFARNDTYKNDITREEQPKLSKSKRNEIASLHFVAFAMT